jgi:gluconokinase
MGVSGSGKSAAGSALANALDWHFYDRDDFHPQANVDRMSQGIPLTDEDRLPWLTTLHDQIADCLEQEKSAVVACSALKASYRDQLRQGLENVVFVYLRAEFDLIFGRMLARRTHFMKPAMLQGQFDTLEEPREAIVVDVDQSIDDIVADIIRATGQQNPFFPRDSLS